jgi:hypothetical protein
MCLVDAASSGRPKHGSCALCVVAGGREEKKSAVWCAAEVSEGGAAAMGTWMGVSVWERL